MNRYCFFVTALLIALASCTPQKEIVYFQHFENNASQASDFELKIFPEDILSVQLFTINPEALPGLSANFDKGIVDNRTFYEKGFVVDRFGYLDLPLAGKLKIAGLSLSAAKDSITNRFTRYIDDPVVVLKKLSFKITVLGEVNKPGLYYISNEKMTFAEALGMAGDLTNYGDRTDIKIYRKDVDEKVREIKIDLTSPDALINNRYVHPDDIIYIKPIKRKALANINPALVVITSVISTTAIVISLIIRINGN
ncbi:MAG: polysaccharide biosynthesis/export family protein [Bacteroidia bacterium]|nr:polysaccharide biosynthesis/export family protein [Bacteroidia bacterium]